VTGRHGELGFETLAIRAGAEPDAATGAVVPPISLSTTFAQEGVARHRGWEYARSGNPTRAGLEACVAALEGAAHGFAFASGLAAEDAILRLLGDGEGVILGDDAYGGTYRLIHEVHGPAGHPWHARDLTDPDRLAADAGGWPDDVRLVWLETPTNPALRIVDIAAVSEIAHAHGAMVVVDNTFATPYLTRPLEHGADIVVHSSTKYLGGHSDVVGGFVALDDPGLAERIGFLQNAVGAVPSPFDCYLVQRGVKTLAVRLDRQCANARAVAELLVGHPAVDRVLWPGLDEHPGHEVAKRQMHDYGGMVSFTLRAGEAAAVAVCEATELFTLAESLGAVESLIEHPARMTHASAAGSPLAVDPALVRLSVGIESATDLTSDLLRALDRAAGPHP
jgi:cystathionine gamma-synthase